VYTANLDAIHELIGDIGVEDVGVEEVVFDVYDGRELTNADKGRLSKMVRICDNA
jgi:hypothetical protein